MNKRKKSVDKTYLSIDTAEARGFIHRDYIAHCLRWTHVIKRMYERGNYENAVILDVGCGQELPLATTLYSSRLAPRAYIGVDVGPVPDETMAKFHGKFIPRVFEHTDILDVTPEDLKVKPNWTTCFEMLEHVEPAHMLKVLDHLKTLVAPGAIMFFSTPCWNGVDTADNHVNEIRFGALAAAFENAGYEIRSVHGTFASIRDYQDDLRHHQGLQGLFDRLRGYYDVNLLSCVFAPLFPDKSRNCLWEVTPLKEPKARSLRRYPPMVQVPTPWGSSHLWRELDKESHVA